MKVNKRPSTYREQRCCQNCEHSYAYYEWDEETQYFCCFDKEERPEPISVAMAMEDEVPDFDIGGKEYDARYKAWDTWAKGRNVLRQNVCSEHSYKMCCRDNCGMTGTLRDPEKTGSSVCDYHWDKYWDWYSWWW
jgi:hypothetical protein